MRRVCAWCQAELGSEVPDSGGPISHGICKECADYFLSCLEPMSLKTFLDKLKVPVLLVDNDVRILSASQEALEILGKNMTQISGNYGGNVMECAYARMPQGCGRTVHCCSCAIRLAVVETYQTGKSFEAVPAYGDRDFNDEQRNTKFLIYTQKIGELVLLRIDSVSEHK